MINDEQYFLAIDIGSQSIKTAISKKGTRYIKWLGNKPSCDEGFKPSEVDDIDVDTIVKNVLLSIASAKEKYNIDLDDINIVATAGLRSAPQAKRQDVIKRIAAQTLKTWGKALSVNVINGKKEAELTISGVFSNITPKSERLIVIDSGGMSTEVSYVQYDKFGKHKILKTASINMGKKNFNKITYKDMIKDSISSLGLSTTAIADVIMSGDTIHLLDEKKEKSSLYMLDKASSLASKIKQNISKILQKTTNIGYKRALLINEILEQLKIGDNANITMSLRGVKEGVLEKIRISKENQLSFISKSPNVYNIKREVISWRRFAYNNKQDFSYSIKKDKTISLSIKSKNNAPKSGIKIDYKLSKNKVDLKIKTDIKNKNNDAYLKQLVKNAKENGMTELRLKSTNLPEFNQKLEFYARQAGMKILEDGKQKEISQQMQDRLNKAKDAVLKETPRVYKKPIANKKNNAQRNR